MFTFNILVRVTYTHQECFSNSFLHSRFNSVGRIDGLSGWKHNSSKKPDAKKMLCSLKNIKVNNSIKHKSSKWELMKEQNRREKPNLQHHHVSQILPSNSDKASHGLHANFHGFRADLTLQRT